MVDDEPFLIKDNENVCRRLNDIFNWENNRKTQQNIYLSDRFLKTIVKCWFISKADNRFSVTQILLKENIWKQYIGCKLSILPIMYNIALRLQQNPYCLLSIAQNWFFNKYKTDFFIQKGKVTHTTQTQIHNYICCWKLRPGKISCCHVANDVQTIIATAKPFVLLVQCID